MIDPIPFPDGLFSSVAFDLARFTSTNRLYGGITQVREMAEPRWTAKMTTTQLTPASLRAWRAWWDSMRGGLRSFLAYDPAQAYPLAYPTGFGGMGRAGIPAGSFRGLLALLHPGSDSGPFDGTASVSGLSDDDQFSFTVSGLPGGFALATGDLVEIREGDVHGLYRLTASVTASVYGTATLSVEPRVVPGLFTPAAEANFERPSCVMVADPSSWSLTNAAREMPTASFAGIQRVF